jgi:hypothetical protein
MDLQKDIKVFFLKKKKKKKRNKEKHSTLHLLHYTKHGGQQGIVRCYAVNNRI